LASVGDEMRGRGQIISFTGRARGTGRARAGFERGVVGAYLVPHHGGTPGVETSADGVSRVRSPALLALVRWAIQNRDLRVTHPSRGKGGFSSSIRSECSPTVLEMRKYHTSISYDWVFHLTG